MARKRKEKSWSEKLNQAGYGSSNNLSQNQRSLTKEGKAKANSNKSKSGEKVKSAYKNTGINPYSPPSSVSSGSRAATTGSNKRNAEKNKVYTSHVTDKFRNKVNTTNNNINTKDINPYSPQMFKGAGSSQLIKHNNNNLLKNPQSVNKFNVYDVKMSKAPTSDNQSTKTIDSTRGDNILSWSNQNDNAKTPKKKKYKSSEDKYNAKVKAEEIKKDKNFNQYVKQGKQIKGHDEAGYYSDNPLNTLLNKHSKNMSQKDNKETMEDYSKYKFMSKDEINTANAILAKEGREAQVEYLDNLNQELEQRKSVADVKQLKEVKENNQKGRAFNKELYKYRVKNDLKDTFSNWGSGFNKMSGNKNTEDSSAAQLNRQATTNLKKKAVLDKEGNQIYADENGNTTINKNGNTYTVDNDGKIVSRVFKDKNGNMVAVDIDSKGNPILDKNGNYSLHNLQAQYKDTLGSIALEATESLVDQTPQFLAGMATGGLGIAASEAASLGTMFTSVYGSSYKQSRDEGNSDTEAEKFAIASGIKEVLSEKMLGFVPGVTKNNGGFIASTLSKFSKELADNKILRNLVSNTIEEGTEEWLGNGLDVIVNRFAYGEKADKVSIDNILKALGSDEAKHEFLIGALSSIPMSGYSAFNQHRTKVNLTTDINDILSTFQKSNNEVNNIKDTKELVNEIGVDGLERLLESKTKTKAGSMTGTLNEIYSEKELSDMFGRKATDTYIEQLSDNKGKFQGIKNNITEYRQAIRDVRAYKESKENNQGISLDTNSIVKRDVSEYTKEDTMKRLIQYENSADVNFNGYISEVMNGRVQNSSYRVSPSSQDVRNDIKNLTGIDTGNAEFTMRPSFLKEIVNADNGIENSDITKLNYILNDYDSIERGDNPSYGVTPLVIKKTVGDSVYTAEVIPDNTAGSKGLSVVNLSKEVRETKPVLERENLSAEESIETLEKQGEVDNKELLKVIKAQQQRIDELSRKLDGESSELSEGRNTDNIKEQNIENKRGKGYNNTKEVREDERIQTALSGGGNDKGTGNRVSEIQQQKRLGSDGRRNEGYVDSGSNHKRGEYRRSEGLRQPLLLKQSSKHGKEIRAIVKESKENNPKGCCVDVHEASEYDTYKNFVLPDNMGSVSIKPDGDIVSIAKNSKSKIKSVMKIFMDTALENGGIKLDCYGKLARFYNRYGFEAVARVEFNEEYAPVDWNYEILGKPYVYVMRYNPNIDTKNQDLEKVRTFTKNQYEEAIAYRDNLIEEQKKKTPNKGVFLDAGKPFFQADKLQDEKNDTKNNEKSKYSIQRDNRGSEYVKVDTDQDIFEGVKEKDYPKVAKMYMQDYLMGKTQLSKNDEVTINSKGVHKYTNPRQKEYYRSEKMRLTPELRNVLKIAKKIGESKPIKENSKHNKWEYYGFNFKIGNEFFRGKINVGIDQNGKKFYEINKITPISGSEWSAIDHFVSGGKVLSNNSISQNGEIDTKKNKNSINDMTEAERFLDENNKEIRQQKGYDEELFSKKGQEFNEENADKYKVPIDYIGSINEISKKVGVEVRFKRLQAKDNGNVIEGMYKNGVIYLDPESNQKINTIFKHELTHYLKNGSKGEYERLEKFVLRNIYSNTEAREALENRINLYMK